MGKILLLILISFSVGYGQVIDSVVVKRCRLNGDYSTYIDSSITYSYYYKGLLTTDSIVGIHIYTPDSSENYVNIYKINYKYDNFNRLTIKETVKKTSNSWELSAIDTNIYNNQGIIYSASFPDLTNPNSYAYRKYYKYDLLGNEISEVSNKIQNGITRKYKKQIWEYNNNNKLTLEIDSSWWNNSLDHHHKREYLYDSNQHDTLIFETNYYGYFKFRRFFNAQNYLDSIYKYKYLSGAWSIPTKYYYYYNSSGNTDSICSVDEKEVWTYNSQQNILTYDKDIPDFSFHESYSYYNNGLLKSYSHSSNVPAQSSGYYEYDEDGNIIYTREGISTQGWDHETICVYTFEALNPTVGQNNTSNHNIRIFPNPTTGTFQLHLQEPSNIIIQNQLGQVIYSHHLSKGEKQIDLTSYPEGLYFVKVTSKGQQQTSKILKY